MIQTEKVRDLVNEYFMEITEYDNEQWYTNWKERKLEPYSLRHFYVTCRIQSGNNYSEVAQMVGNSVTQIEKTYYRFRREDVV